MKKVTGTKCLVLAVFAVVGAQGVADASSNPNMDEINAMAKHHTMTCQQHQHDSHIPFDVGAATQFYKTYNHQNGINLNQLGDCLNFNAAKSNAAEANK